ncbi:uncharacterized protein LOC143448832 isoform X3 [Clavelina lepadiformis]|uniref:uncharacterized protein LOC143448812 isoform X3 n=1 Tax=Clavelina lepadiformis TaxID=159417 RepID=UPI004043484A
MASTRRTRKDISQSQRDMLISLWETKGMRTAKSEHLNEATINTGLSKNQIKCGELEEIGVAVGGMAFVNDTFNAFGSRDVRPYFLEPSVQSGFIEILHCGKGETMHKSNGRMPYAKINEFSITGMPCGIPFRNPGSYGPVDCQKIIDEQENIIIMKRGNLELAENNLVLLVTTEECENEEH